MGRFRCSKGGIRNALVANVPPSFILKLALLFYRFKWFLRVILRSLNIETSMSWRRVASRN